MQRTTGRQRSRSWGFLPSQPCLLGEFQASERLSKRRNGEHCLRNNTQSCPMASTHTHACPCTHTRQGRGREEERERPEHVQTCEHAHIICSLVHGRCILRSRQQLECQAWAAPQQTNYGDNTGLPDYWLALMVESPWNQFSILLAFHPRRPMSPQGAHGNIFAWLPANGLTS